MREMQENRGCMMHSARRKSIPVMLNFLLFSAILSSWFLIYNAQFDLDYSCLDRLNNLAQLARKNGKIYQKMRSVE